MRKFVVAVALLILIIGVISLLISETRFEEEVVDEWNPIQPSTLYPEWHGYNESDHTGSFFVLRAYGRNEMFRRLLDQGKISRLLLEVNVSASGNVSFKVGKLAYPFQNDTTGETFFSDIFFNTTGKFINEIVTLNMTGVSEKESRIYWLEIRNVEGAFVDISGYVRLKGEMPKMFHPFYGVGTLICLLGSSLVVCGILTKSRK